MLQTAAIFATGTRLECSNTPNHMLLPRILNVNSHDVEHGVGYIAEHRAALESTLAEHGGLLLRNTGLKNRADFEAAVTQLTPKLMRYIGGGSPRTKLGGSIYTSTEYPAQASIPLHCELTYTQTIPTRIWFFCERPSASGGATPIGDMTQVDALLPRYLRDRFRSEGVLYTTRLHGGQGFGKSWQATFETTDRSEVAAHLGKTGASYSWDGDALVVKECAPGYRTHSHNGQSIWTNQAINWHPAHLGTDHFGKLLRVFKSLEYFPKMAYYGNGDLIDAADILLITDACRSCEQVFAWQQGDLLLLDNERVGHGRHPFAGDRSILVAMA